MLFSYLPVAPEITLGGLEDLTLLAGADIILPISFKGTPAPPSITWTLNGEALQTSDRITIEKEDVFTKVVVQNAESSDSGTYELTLRNIAGERKTACTVEIHGKY